MNIVPRTLESYTCFMVYHGHIKDGHIVLNEPATLPEGVEVRVEVVGKPKSARPGPGLCKGMITSMSPDFDAPLEDMKEYME